MTFGEKRARIPLISAPPIGSLIFGKKSPGSDVALIRGRGNAIVKRACIDEHQRDIYLFYTYVLCAHAFYVPRTYRIFI